MKEDQFDVLYLPKVGASNYGVWARWSWWKSGVALKIDGTAGEKLEMLVQDNLTNLVSFHAKASGHVVGA